MSSENRSCPSLCEQTDGHLTQSCPSNASSKIIIIKRQLCRSQNRLTEKLIFEGTQFFHQSSLCDKIYRHELGLKLHEKFCPYANQLVRSETTSFQWVRCVLVFNNPIQMKEHILKKHNGNWRETTSR